MDTVNAPSALRDQFLDSLDATDPALCQRLAADLQHCKNALPGMTCEQLGLPRGSTYGSAARLVLTSPELRIPLSTRHSNDS